MKIEILVVGREVTPTPADFKSDISLETQMNRNTIRSPSGKSGLRPVFVSHSSVITWKRFGRYSRPTMSGLGDATYEISDEKI